MTISSSTRTAGPFLGDGSTTALPFGFKVFATTDVLVQRTSADGAQLALTLGGDYTVALNADQNAAPGGVVTLLDPAVDFPTGSSITLTSAVAATQPLSLANGGPFLAKSIEDALDRLTLLLQQQALSLDGAVRAPLVETLTELPAATARRGKMMAFDPSTGDLVLTGFTATQVANAVAAAYASSSIPLYVSATDFGAIGDGATDDIAAIQEAMDVSRNVVLPDGSYLVSGTLISNFANQSLIGAGGNLLRTKIISSATSGPVIQFKQRSPRMEGIAIDATSARRAASTTTGHGILMGGDDNPTDAAVIISRQWLRDVLIINQPTDGVHSRFGCEMSAYHQVTVIDCIRHGYVFDDGTTSGCTNKGIQPFHWSVFNCRAFECGGNAWVIGNAAQTNTPTNFYALHLEALGCAYDSSKRLVDYQCAFYCNGLILDYPDIEDQQYANATTSGGQSRMARANPSNGIFLSANRTEMRHPYFSSLVASVDYPASTWQHRLTMPKVFAGTYGVNQAAAFTVPSSVVDFVADAASSECTGATRIIRNQSTTAQFRIDGETYRGTSVSTYDARIEQNGTANVASVTSGTATEPSATFMQIDAQADTAPVDSVSRMTRSSWPAGLIVRVTAKSGETMTYNDAVVNSGTAKGFDLGSATRVVTSANELWLVYSAQTDRWKEVLFT